MKFRIGKAGEVSVHRQLREHIIFKISTRELPIGFVMPSVRQLERQLNLHRNTIHKVYAELISERWLVKDRGRRLVVLGRPDAALPHGCDNLDRLMDRLLCAAGAQGVTPEQAAARILEQGAATIADHFVIVEPESGMGKMMQYEVQKTIGRCAKPYPVGELRQHPELLAGAALLVPAYLMDLLDFVSPRQRAAAVALEYSKFDGAVELVRRLAKPSIVGMVSVTGPGLTTITGEIADAIGKRHTLCHYWMEWPQREPGKPVIRRLPTASLPPPIAVRVPAGAPVPASAVTAAASQESEWNLEAPLASLEDLHPIDLLFCDSITYDVVRHPHRVRYQLLSPESLQKIAAVRLRQDRCEDAADGNCPWGR